MSLLQAAPKSLAGIARTVLISNLRYIYASLYPLPFVPTFYPELIRQDLFFFFFRKDIIIFWSQCHKMLEV